MRLPAKLVNTIALCVEPMPLRILEKLWSMSYRHHTCYSLVLRNGEHALGRLRLTWLGRRGLTWLFRLLLIWLGRQWLIWIFRLFHLELTFLGRLWLTWLGRLWLTWLGRLRLSWLWRRSKESLSCLWHAWEGRQIWSTSVMSGRRLFRVELRPLTVWFSQNCAVQPRPLGLRGYLGLQWHWRWRPHWPHWPVR